MGLFGRLRGQSIDIVEFLDDSRDTIVWRFPRQDNEIKMGAKLVVREGQTAVFVNEGTVADVFPPGTYTLQTQNLPVLTDLQGWKYGFNSPFKAEVYFAATRQFTDLKWGTAHPITLRDPEFGMVRLRAFGAYSLRVIDAAKLLRQLVGTDPMFSTDEVGEFLRRTIVGQVVHALANANIPVLDVAANQQTIAQSLAGALSTNLADMGVEIPRFIIENVSLPPEVEAALDKRTSMGVVGDLGRYTQWEAANAIDTAASNPGGAGTPVGLGVGLGLGQQVAAAMTSAAKSEPEQPDQAPTSPPPLPTPEPYYLGVNGQQVGPLQVGDLPARIASGELTRDTLVWQRGMAEWTPAGQVAELASLFATGPPPLPPA